jgi:Flp pilus assembly pilin Flp
MLRKLTRDTTGASAIEYAIIASVVSIAAIGAFIALGSQSKANMEKVQTAYEQAG